MTDNTEWLLTQIETLKQKQPAYEDRAFLTALQQVVQQQATRSEQIQGELDGRLWNHGNW
ncbi:hypothetical protein [Lentilactobacillus kribbianus]|uniref:hypothetical protein n=1 Tax=Lentilactobacillus kribbianus TaxID=2729622 RepID=UPI0015523B67|nr:hypothetical protein [Lentilactobacillus kribbianus]